MKRKLNFGFGRGFGAMGVHLEAVSIQSKISIC